jgi:hypothetical protein
MHSITRDARGRFVPVVRPKRWKASSLVRSRERSDRIATARMERKKTLTTTQWLQGLDGRAIAELEATGIPWLAVERWLDTMDQRETFAARMVVKQVLQTLADDSARPAERFEARRELYRRLISSGVID